MSFKKFLITEAEMKVNAKEYISLCKTLEGALAKIDKTLDSDAIKMSGNPNVSGMLNKLKGKLVCALDLAVEVVTVIGERKEAEKLEFPHAKKMSDRVGTDIVKSAKGKK